MASGISVIIPARNSAATILNSLRSVAWQTTLPDEVIVVDDRSTDATVDIVEAYRDSSPVPIQIQTGEGTGAGAARNVGVARSSGANLAFLDADDMWYPDKLAMQLPLVEDRVVVGCLMHYISPSGRVLGTNARYDTVNDANLVLLNAEAMPLALSSWLMRRDDFESLGGFDTTFLRAQDFEFAHRLARAGCTFLWPPDRALMGYTIHSGGVSATSYSEQFMAAELVRYRASQLGESVSYADWMNKPRISRAVRRRCLSGAYYRQTAVLMGTGRPLLGMAYGLASTVLAPGMVAGKLSWRSRGQSRIQPVTPPRVVLDALG